MSIDFKKINSTLSNSGCLVKLSIKEVYNILFKNNFVEKHERFYANHLLIEKFYYPYLNTLNTHQDISQEVYECKLDEMHAFYTLWFDNFGEIYPEKREYALVTSPNVAYAQARLTINGDFLKNTSLGINLISANLLRQAIELLLLEACGYPLNKNNRSPSLSKIVEALTKNEYKVEFSIDSEIMAFLPDSYDCLDILNIFYKYLSKILHKNQSGLLFSWQLEFMQQAIAKAFQKTIPRIDNIIQPQLDKDSSFYKELKCTPNI